MIIHTFWVLHEGPSEAPECTVARDEDAIAINPEAWEQAKQANLQIYGLKVENAREIRIWVDERKILAAFESDSITGKVL